MDSTRAEAFGVLGIPVDSDPSAVVHAYRRLARATHPDISNDPDAADRFAAVAAAYQLVTQIPRPTSIPVRIHPSAPGDEGRSQASVRVPSGSALSDPMHLGQATPWSTVLSAWIGGRVPIVAGPARVDPPRRPARHGGV